MKKIVKIEQDYVSPLSIELRNEDVEYLVNEEISIFCEIANNKFVNFVEKLQHEKTSKEDFKNSVTVEAKGYSQGVWQRYTIYHNLEDDNKYLNQLADVLKKSFTHQNDYDVATYESIERDGKTYLSIPQHEGMFCITDIEFPEKEDVIKAYNEQFGGDYDEIIVKL